MTEIALKVVVLGSPKSGKTSFVERFCFGTFGNSKHVGDVVRNTIKLRGKRFAIQMWDSSHKSLIPDPGNTGPSGLIARGAHGCIAMYDITDKDSLYNAAKQIEEFRNSARPEAQAMLIGNKFDMASTKRQIRISEASALVKHYDMTGIMETSVKNNQGIEEAIELLIDAIYSNVLLQDSVDLGVGSKTPPGIRKRDGCCS